MHLRTNKSVEDFFELWCRQLKNFQIKGRIKAHGFIVPRQMGSVPVRLMKGEAMTLRINLGEQSYDIVVEKGSLKNASNHLDLNRKVLILTDSGVPKMYSEAVLKCCKEGYVYVIKQGEKSKSFKSYTEILKFMVEKSFTRRDLVVCVGGGVCGDLGGFVASTYMRGIDFYNVPTTLLSQLDSSIGGKVAIDFEGIKNIVGAFYQPKKVLIDMDTLKTLEKRQLYAGLCEGIKMAACCDKELFELIENSTDLEKDLEKIIIGGLKIKADVVEKDPKEKNLRKVLNFGHTIGHAVESHSGELLHGECVSIGMLYFSSKSVRERLKRVLEKYNLPTSYNADFNELTEYINRDKKSKGDSVSVIAVKEIGSFEIIDMKKSEIEFLLKGGNIK